jgi:hypothetical protein
MTADIKDQLRRHLANATELPFLFVGSGMSLRYLQLETWWSLLLRFASQVSKNPQSYRSKSDNDPPKCASLLAQDFHDAWWKEPQFEKNRILCGDWVNKTAGPLKIEIADHINPQVA